MQCIWCLQNIGTGEKTRRVKGETYHLSCHDQAKALAPDWLEQAEEVGEYD